MAKNTNATRQIALILFFLFFGTAAALAQTEVDATATWGPPEWGPPVDHYILQLSTNEGPWVTVAMPTSTSAVIQVTQSDSHRIRVAGVDADGVQGPFCAPSPPYTPGGGLNHPSQPNPMWME